MALSKIVFSTKSIFSGRVFKGALPASSDTAAILNAVQDEVIINAASAAANLASVNTLKSNNTLLETDGTVKACLVNGVTLIAGGTGIADLTLAAPTASARSIIRIASLSSGSVVVTCAAGVTVDGTNNTMTFDAAEETIELVYKSATEWAIVKNDGGVALSDV